MTRLESSLGRTVRLRDGRRLGFAEYGESTGRPVFHFHGSGGSRLEHPPDQQCLNELGIRFIGTDRPGHGLSDPKPDRTLLDWPDDVGELADQLGIDKFHVLGWSAGGPHALACGYKLRDRVVAGAIASGLAPPQLPAPYRGLSFGCRIVALIMRKIPRMNYLFRRGMDSHLRKLRRQRREAERAAEAVRSDVMCLFVVGQGQVLDPRMPDTGPLERRRRRILKDIDRTLTTLAKCRALEGRTGEAEAPVRLVAGGGR